MSVTLDEVIDAVMQLPPEQQEMLVNVIYRRRIERRRQEIAGDARESIAKYRAGQLKPQPIEDNVKELRLSLDEES